MFELDDEDENDDGDEENEQEEDDDEGEDEPDGNTTVEMDSHVYTTQVFNVVTELDEIILRIEHSDGNWIGSPFYSTYYNVFEEPLEVEADGTIELSVSAGHHMNAMFINGIEVEFTPIEYGYQQFIFNVEFE